MQRIVGIGEMIISNDINDKIKTFALASCVGVTAYSYQRRVGGIIHIALPTPGIVENLNIKSCYYASTGLPLFINTLCNQYECSKRELNIQLYGGANSIRPNDTFNIGRKNIQKIKEIFVEMNLDIKFEEIGEIVSRTIELDMSNGHVNIWRQNIII